MTEPAAGPVDTTTVVPPLKTDPMTVGPMATHTHPRAGATKESPPPPKAGSPPKAGRLNAGSLNVGRLNAGRAAGVVAALAVVIGATIARAPTMLASAARDLFVEDISVTPLGHRRCRPVGAAGNLGAAFDVLALAKK
jgi:hypothetical protein